MQQEQVVGEFIETLAIGRQRPLKFGQGDLNCAGEGLGAAAGAQLVKCHVPHAVEESLTGW